jgi:hypothetical protein
MIYDEPRREDPRDTVITKGGIVTGEDRMTQGKTTKDSGVGKSTEKTQNFDAKKDKYLKRQEKRSNHTKALHRKHDQK